MRNQILQGDALATLRTLPDNHVQTIVTSPPYYGLRDYGMEAQIGLEETPAAYVNKLVEVFSEACRVLRDDGLLWLNLGDSYSGSGKGFGGENHGKLGKYANDFLPKPIPTYDIKPKNLIGIPWRVAFALQDVGWILRSEIIWHKPNAMPESVQDRPTKSHETVFLFAKQERYFYDAEAIREKAVKGSSNAGTRNYRPYVVGRISAGQTEQDAINGRNKRSVWSIPTVPYREAHFAVMAPELAKTCILAGSRPGDIVLDPFSGAGTTAYVANRLNRGYLGIELNPEYVELSRRRLAQMALDLYIDEGIEYAEMEVR